MMKTRIFVQAISAILILSFAVLAQTDQGRISGTVTDAQGALVPGAAVTVTNEQTGEARTVTAKSDGSFLVLALRPTRYTITATANGFETIRKKGVDVLVGQELN